MAAWFDAQLNDDTAPHVYLGQTAAAVATKGVVVVVGGLD